MAADVATRYIIPWVGHSHYTGRIEGNNTSHLFEAMLNGIGSSRSRAVILLAMQTRELVLLQSTHWNIADELYVYVLWWMQK